MTEQFQEYGKHQESSLAAKRQTQRKRESIEEPLSVAVIAKLLTSKKERSTIYTCTKSLILHMASILASSYIWSLHKQQQQQQQHSRITHAGLHSPASNSIA